MLCYAMLCRNTFYFLLASSSFSLLLLPLMLLSDNSIYFLRFCVHTDTIASVCILSTRNTPGISCAVTDVISLFTKIFRHAKICMSLFSHKGEQASSLSFLLLRLFVFAHLPVTISRYSRTYALCACGCARFSLNVVV